MPAATRPENRPDPTPLLRMRGITKQFGGVTALAGVDLDIYPGEVHALMGENGAGKSTLMKVLSGAHSCSSGTIEVDGRDVAIRGPADSKAVGISIIYQELALAANLTVADNMLLGRERSRFGFLDRKAAVSACRTVLDNLAVDFQPTDKVGTLSLAQRQQVEIARALLADCRILVMDEPTTSLSSRESERLFAVVNRLRLQGLAIVYISHRMDEVYALADRVTVLRDGRYIGSIVRRELTEERLVRMMVGRDLTTFYQKNRAEERQAGPVLMSVRNLRDGFKVRGVSFDLRRGEVLGLGGIVGAGRTEFARLVYGMGRRIQGTVEIDGTVIDIVAPADAIAAGIVYLTEDRKHDGLFLDMSASDNVNIAAIGIDRRACGFLNAEKARSRTDKAIADMSIALADRQANVGHLSGGNQQKVLLARLLQTNPKLIILDEPTRGVDIGAKSQIYQLIEALAERGVGILVISSDLPELVGISDRVVVMRDGRIAGEVGGTSGVPITSEAIIAIATGSTGRDALQKEAP